MSNLLTAANIAKIDKLVEKSKDKSFAAAGLAAAAQKKTLQQFLMENWPTAKPILLVLRTFAFFKPSWQKWLDVFISGIDTLLLSEA